MTDEIYKSAVPVIATEDVLASIRYFEQTLGFTKHFLWGDPPVYAGVKAGNALLYICHDPKFVQTIKERGLAPDIFLWVTNIESLYAQHRANGAEIIDELKDRPWDTRQYVVREPNGYHLKIAEPMDDEDV